MSYCHTHQCKKCSDETRRYCHIIQQFTIKRDKAIQRQEAENRERKEQEKKWTELVKEKLKEAEGKNSH